MFCKNCGAKLSEGVKFCSNCGAAFEVKPSQIQKTPVCKECGAELAEGVKFCSSCGAVRNEQPSKQSNSFNITPQKQKLKKSFVGGIAMAVFGFIGIYGGTVNGTFEKMSTYGADISDIITILLEVGLILGGAYLAYKGATSNNK